VTYSLFLRTVHLRHSQRNSAQHTHTHTYIHIHIHTHTHTHTHSSSHACAFSFTGVFFKYDFSELRIKYTEQSKYFSTFLTRVCAVVGGVFVVIGLVYKGFVIVYQRTTGRKLAGFGDTFGSSLLGSDRLTVSA
jgi:Endoplasmic reticulum vesicle transporter